MGSRTGLNLDYVSLAELETARWAGVMGVATFNGAAVADGSSGLALDTTVPVAEVKTPVLGDSGCVCEVWRTPQKVETGTRGGVRYARTSGMLFGCISVPEPDDASAAAPEQTSLYRATERAY